MNAVVVINILTNKILFTGSAAQCQWFIEMKGLTEYSNSYSSQMTWIHVK